ncbi:Hypothetical protein c5165 [Escherichia coli CFT073]|uniref:Uncharacterized protein n=1 Tax=Escherichia coli O6:H1 (strain CFT073 / ATCC 700928 / UPEC) TaxID=199310 RepID=A0A0H2VG06_ECOL6|nr:Hypothetical protein c5165 [Escherichia coli CFT073]
MFQNSLLCCFPLSGQSVQSAFCGWRYLYVDLYPFIFFSIDKLFSECIVHLVEKSFFCSES